MSSLLSVHVLSLLEINTRRDTKNLKTNECEDKWYLHQLEPALENETCKIPCDFAIQTDKEIELRRLNIVFTDKEKRECKILDIGVH